MSNRTQAYTVMFGTWNSSIGPPLFTNREEAEQCLRECRTARLMVTELEEEEYAELCVSDLQSQSDYEWRKRTGIVPPEVMCSKPEPARLFTVIEPEKP